MAVSTEVAACLRCGAPTALVAGNRYCADCGWRECAGAD
jgi:ribosomal protein L37E